MPVASVVANVCDGLIAVVRECLLLAEIGLSPSITALLSLQSLTEIDVVDRLYQNFKRMVFRNALCRGWLAGAGTVDNPRHVMTPDFERRRNAVVISFESHIHQDGLRSVEESQLNGTLRRLRNSAGFEAIGIDPDAQEFGSEELILDY